MSRLSPIKPHKLIKILLLLGFRNIRQKGSHLFFKHHDGRATVVPFHRGEDIGKGLLKKILQDIELTWAEFERYL